MKKENVENWGRVCQAAAYELNKTLGEIAASSFDASNALLGGLLEPEYDIPTIVDGQLWSRHECRRCGMAVLLLSADNSQAKMDITHGECITKKGREIVESIQFGRKEPDKSYKF